MHWPPLGRCDVFRLGRRGSSRSAARWSNQPAATRWPLAAKAAEHSTIEPQRAPPLGGRARAKRYWLKRRLPEFILCRSRNRLKKTGIVHRFERKIENV
jgi:hypothetical protein